MSVTGYLAAIIAELTRNQAAIAEDTSEALVDEIQRARHVFLAGAGRSGLAASAFANRLMHLGVSVSRIGELTSPHTQPGDLLIVVSGSGETDGLVAVGKRAAAAGLRLALVTMDDESRLGKLADLVLVLPGTSPKLTNSSRYRSIQPMGSAFEQLTGLLFDAIVLALMDERRETSDTMFVRHADLE